MASESTALRGRRSLERCFVNCFVNHMKWSSHPHMIRSSESFPFFLGPQSFFASFLKLPTINHSDCVQNVSKKIPNSKWQKTQELGEKSSGGAFSAEYEKSGEARFRYCFG